jgi:site-specific DNA recombinase
VSEGEITQLHVGFKGTMNALYLKDLADKTRRGMVGRVEHGKSGGGLCYGYRVVRGAEGVTTGDRAIEPNEAAVILRIFRKFIGGASPKSIAQSLNREHVPGPSRRGWNPSTINGHLQRGTGILNNELYVGRLVWNRLRYVKDPDTGRRVSRLNNASEWISKDVPHLRIVPDELWRQAKARQAHARADLQTPVDRLANPVILRRPRFLFSGLTTCGECGAGFHIYSGDRLACYGHRVRRSCSNNRTVRRGEVERRVLVALQEKMLQPELIEEFSREFTREMNRLRMAHRANTSNARLERTRVQREIDQVIKAILEGFTGTELKAKMSALQARKTELDAQLAATEAPVALLHPNMAEVYRAKVQ